jgi:hypothetical protein
MKLHGTHWSQEELIAAKAMFDAGSSYAEIGEKLGRTDTAIYDRLLREFKISRMRPEYFDGPAIGLTVECQRIRKDAKLGSQILREACLDLFQRTANKYMIRMDDAMACHLGHHSKPVIPGTERVIRGQAAERLAA